MAVAGSSWGNLGILRGRRVEPLVAPPPQSSGEFLLDQILDEEGTSRFVTRTALSSVAILRRR